MKTRLAAFLLISGLAGRALADVTITGTVGEIGVGTYTYQGGGQPIVRFKMTDLNQTKTCNPTNSNNTLVGYAWFFDSNNSPQYKEWYAQLLVSKKGAPISCTISDSTQCLITSCTLP